MATAKAEEAKLWAQWDANLAVPLMGRARREPAVGVGAEGGSALTAQAPPDGSEHRAHPVVEAGKAPSP